MPTLGRSFASSLVLSGGGMGSLGTLFVRMAADPSNMIREMNRGEAAMVGSVDRMNRSLSRISLALTSVFALAGASFVREAIRFESSFAGVRKTMDATESEFKELSDQFKQLAREIPVNVNEINKIGEIAGQLGIERQHLERFVKTMANLSRTTNLTSETASSDLARLANIIQMPQKEFERLGSILVDLGNKFPTTEAEILTMAMRIAGAGHTIGLTVDQIVSFAAALSSVGIEAELGGTAISRAMIKIAMAISEGGEDLELYAAIADKTISDFSESFRTKGAQTIIEFFEGLRKLKDEGADLFSVLEKLGIDELRLIDTTARLAGAGDLLRRVMQAGNQAWKENTALSTEAAKRYETFRSQITLTWGRLRDLSITIGDALVPALRILNNGLLDITNDSTSFIETTKEIGRVFAGPLLFSITTVGDALNGWKLIMKGGELSFLQMSSTFLSTMATINRLTLPIMESLHQKMVGVMTSIIKDIRAQTKAMGADPSMTEPLVKLVAALGVMADIKFQSLSKEGREFKDTE